MTQEKETIQLIIEEISDPAVKLIASHALTESRKAMNMSHHVRKTAVADQISKILTKAMKLRS